ncbi:MAG: hypothetical protein WBF77_06245 [Sulfurimonadaceae bacterium]
MNDFTPKEIHKASQYLQEKLESAVKKPDTFSKIEEEKSSYIKQLITSLFK